MSEKATKNPTAPTAVIRVKNVSLDQMNTYKQIGWAIVVLNFATFFVLVLSSSKFADASMNFSFFTLMHLTALVSAAFALRDNNNVMLYPILVSLVAFIFVPFLMWSVFVSGWLYCFSVLKMKNNTTSAAYPIECESRIPQVPFWVDLLLFLIGVEKCVEFFVFRRLMKMFERYLHNAHFCATDIRNAFSATIDDPDDEIIVFERVSKGGKPSVQDYGATSNQ